MKKFIKMKREFNNDGKLFQNLIKKGKGMLTKNSKKSNWFSKNGKYKGFMFVDTTPESELKNRIQKAADKNKIPIKVIEKASNSIKTKHTKE